MMTMMGQKMMSRKRGKVYVIHFCRNKECNNGWLDEDLTNVKTFPPQWKYCRECADKFGVDFDKQTPTDAKSNKEKERDQKLREATE